MTVTATAVEYYSGYTLLRSTSEEEPNDGIIHYHHHDDDDDDDDDSSESNTTLLITDAILLDDDEQLPGHFQASSAGASATTTPPIPFAPVVINAHCEAASISSQDGPATFYVHTDEPRLSSACHSTQLCRVDDDSPPPPPGAPAGGIWGVQRYRGKTTTLLTVGGVLLLGLPGLLLWCWRADQRPVYQTPHGEYLDTAGQRIPPPHGSAFRPAVVRSSLSPRRHDNTRAGTAA